MASSSEIQFIPIKPNISILCIVLPSPVIIFIHKSLETNHELVFWSVIYSQEKSHSYISTWNKCNAAQLKHKWSKVDTS